MRTILVVLLCLVIGAAAALGYSHFLGEGKQLAQALYELDMAHLDLAKVKADTLQAKMETDAMSAQIQQLTATKDDLKKQVDELKSAAPVAATPPAAPNPMANMAGMMKAGMAQHQQEQLLLLKSRLHLTPEQEAAVKVAMDEEGKRGEEMAAKMMAGGKIDSQTMADMGKFKSVDQTLNDILTPDQKTDYQQMKTDQKNSAAETMATVQLNQIAPLLQLSDAQKDQAYTALAQVQLDTQDPAWIKNNLGSGAIDPTAILDAQAKAKEDAMAKILTPDQLAIYHQQAQSQLAMTKAMMPKFSAPAANSPVVTAPAPVVAPVATGTSSP